MKETFTDPRDGKTYKTVRIGNQIWIAENLAYEGVSYRFPNRDSDNAPEYGYLYNWEEAKKACPPGWRLPTKTDFDNLLAYVALTKTADTSDFLALIANSTAWIDYRNRGLDDFGFGALPAGDHFSSYYCFGRYGYFWSSTELEKDNFYAYNLILGCGNANVSSCCKTSGFSVRCIKD